MEGTAGNRLRVPPGKPGCTSLSRSFIPAITPKYMFWGTVSLMEAMRDVGSGGSS